MNYHFTLSGSLGRFGPSTLDGTRQHVQSNKIKWMKCPEGWAKAWKRTFLLKNKKNPSIINNSFETLNLILGKTTDLWHSFETLMDSTGCLNPTRNSAIFQNLPWFLVGPTRPSAQYTH